MIDRYTELVFRTEEELDEKIMEIKRKCEWAVPGSRNFRVDEGIIRVKMYKWEDRYFLVNEPREPFLPRVFTVAIPYFRLCEILIRGEVCNRRVVSVVLRDELLFDVCGYHGAGTVPVVDIWRQIKEVPGALCAKFCPQYFKYNEVRQCRAFLKPLTVGEEKRRSRPWRGMSFLCLEDVWWRYMER